MRILIFDDEIQWCKSLKNIMVRYSLASDDNIETATTKSDAYKILSGGGIDLLLLDLLMPDASGEEVLKEVVPAYPGMSVVMVSGLNNIESAIRCVRLGAIDYIIKSLDAEDLIAIIAKAIKMVELKKENVLLKTKCISNSLEHEDAFKPFITASEEIFSIFRYLEVVSQSSQPILITGESGVGKGLLAKIIHEISRPDKPFVSVNISGLDSHMFDDTLFGHVKGAFTGADKERTGIVTAANGGTLFLDEIGELSNESQLKLLNLTQDREYRKLGRDSLMHTSAGFIFATNQKLCQLQEKGLFRKDLYYRLSTHTVHIPPLRERPADIPLLVNHFLKEAALELNKNIVGVQPNVLRLLSSHCLKGNVRQLKSIIFEAVAHCPGDELTLIDLQNVRELSGAVREASVDKSGSCFPTIHEAVNDLVMKVLKEVEGNQSRAAVILGISQPALSRRLKNINSKQ